MADEIKATPVKNKQAAGVAGALQGLHSFVSKPFGYDNPPGQMLSQFVGIPDIASALERIGYGEPLTTGSGQTLKLRDDVLNAIMAIAPFAQATKGLPVGAATKSPIAIAELEKLAKIKAEMAAKNAADEALKPQYNEAVKGMTQKQNPPSFEEWKAINHPEPEMAEGGAVYNTDPDMSDGGQIIQGAPFKHGGDVNLDAMYMAVNDAKFRRK